MLHICSRLHLSSFQPSSLLHFFIHLVVHCFICLFPLIHFALVHWSQAWRKYKTKKDAEKRRKEASDLLRGKKERRRFSINRYVRLSVCLCV